MERSLKVEAIVLRHSDWGEADRLLWLYSREQGKLTAIAKGVRKLHSRKAGHLEPFMRVSLLLARGHDLWIVTQAEAVEAYLPLRESLVRTGQAAYVIELLDRFTYEEGANRQLYQLLADTLQRLAQEPDAAIFTVLHYYEMRLLDLVGYRPQLFECAGCGGPIRPQDQFFSAAQGGALCPNCGLAYPATRPISMDALRYIRHYQRSSYPEAQRAAVPAAVQAEIETLMQFYLTYLLERGLNTPGFLRDVSPGRMV